MSSFDINENSSLLGNEEIEKEIPPKDEVKDIAPPGIHIQNVYYIV